MPIAAWIWLRGGRRRWAVVIFAGGLLAQAAWLSRIATAGLGAVLDPDVGMDGWGGWSLGVAGLVALYSGLRYGREAGRDGRIDPDRALEIALGLFGVGVLLRLMALVLPPL